MRPQRALLAAIVGSLVVASAVTASGDDDHDRELPQGSDPVRLDPRDFSLTIDNPWWPMRPGSQWVFRETDTEGSEQKWSSR